MAGMLVMPGVLVMHRMLVRRRVLFLPHVFVRDLRLLCVVIVLLVTHRCPLTSEV